ncbi:MAG: hypothetical protein U9Q15_05285 [Patescibacteria group bacterium]|nr:hypothetical protein [Patescibacteria group bacterium]
MMFQEGYMVMEKVAGSSLFDLTGGFEYNDSEIPKEYFEQIGQFLAQMHQLPIPEFLQS